MGRRKKNADESMMRNTDSYQHYFNMLKEMAVSMFEWDGFPDSVNTRFLETQLFYAGRAICFRDDVTTNLLTLEVIPGSGLDVYGEPISRRANGRNGYQYEGLDDSNSVIIYNNMTRTGLERDCRHFASRLWELDEIVRVNCKAQKTPVLIQGRETQKLTLTNLYKEYEGNAPVIFADNNIDMNSLSVLKTDAPFVSDKIYALKQQIWNEALVTLGISNMAAEKKERLLTAEVAKQAGGTDAMMQNRLKMREEAAARISEMFSITVTVKLAVEVPEEEGDADEDEGGDDDE